MNKIDKIRLQLSAIVVPNDQGCICLGNLTYDQQQLYFKLSRKLNKLKDQETVSLLSQSDDVSESEWDNAGEKNSCGVYAVSNLLDISYGKAHKLLQDNGRKFGKGTTILVFLQIGLKELTIEKSLSLRNFIKQYNTGKYLICVKKHCLVVDNGNIKDNTETSLNSKIRKIYVTN
jgi:hypothetical protein